MSWPAIIAIYFVVWWTTLFAILPFGVRSQLETGDIAPGSEAGAPARPALMQKVLWTTVVSAIVFGLFYANYVNGWVTVDNVPFVPRFQGPMR